MQRGQRHPARGNGGAKDFDTTAEGRGGGKPGCCWLHPSPLSPCATPPACYRRYFTSSRALFPLSFTSQSAVESQLGGFLSRTISLPRDRRSQARPNQGNRSSSNKETKKEKTKGKFYFAVQGPEATFSSLPTETTQYNALLP